jgi:hypothetical protein
MPKISFKRNTFSEETPNFNSNTLKKIKIYESRNIMQIILDIKLQARVEAQYTRRLMPEKFKLEKEEDDSFYLGRD